MFFFLCHIKSSPVASIGRLTEEFVVTLQANFPATISTLFRIGDKLKSNYAPKKFPESDSRDDSICLLCISAIEEETICSASNARSVSQEISRSGPNGFKGNSTQVNGVDKKENACTRSGCSSQEKSCCSSSVKRRINEDWSAVLCYGCRITMEEVNEPELMPIDLQEKLRLRSRRQVMRQSVEQFLL